MSRIILIISLCVSQSFIAQDTGFFNEPDFVPIPKNGGWVWYNITNDSTSKEYAFTDFIIPPSGYCSDFVLKNDSMWGVMSGFDAITYPFIYDSIILSNDHLITLSNGGWNYHNRKENGLDSLIPILLDSIYSYENITYLYSKGKVGAILRNGSFVPPIYDVIHPFNCSFAEDPNFSLNESGPIYLMSLKDKEYNLLNDDGKELLPTAVWDLRCTEDYVFEFRRATHPEFFVPSTQELINPNGRDIVFYGGYGHKVYNVAKTRSELFLNGGGNLKESYDDYFPLSEEYIVVRKNGKVGLTRRGTQLIGSIKYDQINAISEFSNGKMNPDYFTFYHGDSCGLMTETGVELFPARFANVIQTADPDRFIVLDNRKTGVVDRSGRIIIPIEFDHIHLDNTGDLFVMQLGKLMGLYRRDGSVLVPIEYDKHISQVVIFELSEQNPLHVLGKNNQYFFANSKGLIDKNGSDHYDYTGDVLKTYSKNGIIVYAMDTKGLVEETRNYPLYKPTIIKDNYFSNWLGLTAWYYSTLEENQKEGYFGLRHYTQRGFGVEPKYRTIRNTCFGTSVYLGEVAYQEDSRLLIEGIPMQLIRSYDMLNSGSGKVEHKPLYNSEFQMMNSGSGERRVNFELNGKQVVSSTPYVVLDNVELSEPILYGDYVNENVFYRRLYKGGRAEICEVDSATVSLYDYYQYWNAIDACRVAPDMMKKILDPKVGVRFVNSEVVIFNSSWGGVRPDMRSMDMPAHFADYNFLTELDFFERKLGVETGILKQKILKNKKDQDEVEVLDVFNATTAPGFVGELIVAEVRSREMAKIHVDFPNFYFVQDSIFLSYDAGRLNYRIDSNLVRLITPSGKTVVDSCILIRFLGEERFALLNEKGWRLIDRDGNEIHKGYFFQVNDFLNNRALVQSSEGVTFEIDRNGKRLEPLPEQRIFADVDHYFYASKPGDIIDVRTSIGDRCVGAESYQTNGFFISKSEGESALRRFGSNKTISLKTMVLKSFGSGIYYQDGKNLFSIDSTLKLQKHKKIEKFAVITSEIGWLEGKRDELVDKNWNRIHLLEKNERFELSKGELLVFKGDSIVHNFGNITPKSESPDKDTLRILQEVTVVSENGKYGVMRGEEIVLPMAYPWLSKINDSEFYTRTISEKRVYNTSLKRIGDHPYDWFIQTANGNFVFYRAGTFTAVNIQGTN